MNRIAIIGAGWLGLPLAQQLIKNGETVFATRRETPRLQELVKKNVPCFPLSLSGNKPEADRQFVSQLINNDISIVIGAFPPGFRQGGGDAYAVQWQTLVSSCQEAGVEKLIMISSSTVYPDMVGIMTEEHASLTLAQGNPSFSDKARIMLRAEQSVIDSGLDYVILRYSGLFGPNRHPARFVNKLSSVSSKAPANMLHLDDAIASAVFSIRNISREIVNVTSPITLSKADFYQAAIDSYDSKLTLPPRNENGAKQISPDKLLQKGFEFKYTTATQGLAHC